MRRSTLLAPYHRNAVLQLISASGVGYLLYQLTVLCFIVYTRDAPGLDKDALAHGIVDPVVGLPALQQFGKYWWTIFTYGWSDYHFFGWISNMLWLYCFGSIVQSLVGHRQVIPAFVYGLLIGGGVFLVSQFMPFAAIPSGAPVMTAQAGIMTLAAASITIAPRYRIYLGDRFSIPLWLVLTIFLAFNLLAYASVIPMLMLGVGGLLTGFGYAKLLKNGYKPAAFAYHFFDRMSRIATPDPMRGKPGNRRKRVLEHSGNQRVNTQQRVDDILDKINRKGYSSLTQQEKDILLRASKESKE